MGFPQIGLESIFKDAGFNAAMKAYKTSVNDAKDLTDMTGKSMGESFASAIGAVGKFGAAVAGLTFAAGVAAFTALGAAAWKAGMDVDNAVDGIIIATGAMGPELDELTESYKRVLSATSSTAAEAGVAVGEISRRWQLTGDDLAELSVQFLDLARLMKVDVKTTITDVALAMEAFNVPAEDAVKVMEQVFVASQKSGVEMGTLLTTVKQYAAPMKALGFNFKTSVAMIAKWTSKGLDANKMVMALRLGIANMVDPTKDADAALEGMGEVSGEMSEKFADAVEAIKNATTETEALNIGMSIFGKRGAVDLVTAIREGKLTAEEFTAAMDDSSGAIERTFQATKDWPELMQQVKNQVTVALEPIGTKFLDIAKIVLEKFMPVFQDVVVPFINDKVVPIFDALGKAMLLLIDGNFAGAIDALLPDSVIQRWKDFSPILGGLADIVKTALKGLTGANIWEDTTTFDIKTGVTVTPGLKSQMIALGNNMLDWTITAFGNIGRVAVMLSAKLAEWGKNEALQDGAKQIGTDIANGIIEGVRIALGLPTNTDKIGANVESSLTAAIAKITANILSVGYNIAGSLSEGIIIGLQSPETQAKLQAGLTIAGTGIKPIGVLSWWTGPLEPPEITPPFGVRLGEWFAGGQDFFKGQWGAITLLYMDARDEFARLGNDIAYGFSQVWITVKEVFTQAATDIGIVVSNITTTISVFLTAITDLIMISGAPITEALEKPFVDAWEFIQTIPGLIMGAFAAIKINIPMPHLSTGASQNEIVPGTGIYWPTFNVDWYAKGLEGIFSSPTLIGVGESGPERVSVMPLRGSEPGRMSSPAGAMGGGGGDNYWVLNITTSAPTENILNDYRLLASMGGAV